MLNVSLVEIKIALRRRLRWCDRLGIVGQGIAETKRRRLSNHTLASLVLAVILSAVAWRVAWADEPPLMRHRPLLRGFGGLCDGGPLPCTRIDQIAFHAGADAIILPSTSLRSTGFVTSYGFSVGILEHVEGGIFSNTAIWGEPSGSQTDTLWQQGPVRFSIKGLLWPWRKNPHQHFAVLLDFEYEARLPHFDGQNQLGLLTDLAVLRAAGNLPVGLAEVGLSIGALFDGKVGYATPELGARVGFHLPFMTDTKVFAEGLVRGLGVWNRTGDPLPGALVPTKPVVPGGALAFGIVTRPRRQVAFALVAHAGFGDVAPFFLTLRGPLDFSMGEGYPYPRSLIVDILREAGEWIAEQRRKLPEPLQQTCVLYGADGQPIATMGHLTKDGEECEFQGQRFRIGGTFYPDPERRQVCLEPEALHCIGAPSASISGMDSIQDAPPSIGSQPNVGAISSTRSLDPAILRRLLNQGALGPIRGELDNRCILNEGEHQVTPVGQLSPDGKHCIVERDVNIIKHGRKLRTKSEQIQIPIGKPIYRDPVTGRVCLSSNTKSNKNCPAVIDAKNNHPLSSGTEVGYHGAIGLVDWFKDKADKAKGGAHLLTHPAELTTAGRRAADRAQQAATKAAETAIDPARAKQAARDAWGSTIDTAHAKWEGANNWYNLPTQKKMNGMAEGAVKGGLDLGATVLLGAAGKTRAGLEAAEAAELTEAGKALETGSRLATEAEGAGKTLAQGVEGSAPKIAPNHDKNLKAKDRRTQERAQSLEEKHGNPNYEEPASEAHGKWQARMEEKAHGKDGRRGLHDMKEPGQKNRSKQEILENRKDLR